MVTLKDALNTSREAARNRKTGPASSGSEHKEGRPIEDFEYLLHHVTIDTPKLETLRHCFLYDHMANMFEQGHIVVQNGKVYVEGKEIKNGAFHFIMGLETSQEVCWSDSEAEEVGIKMKNMVSGMTKKQKARDW